MPAFAWPKRVEVVPLEPPPMMNCLVSGFTVALQLVELLVARSNEEELLAAWHPGSQEMPILGPCVVLSALFGTFGLIGSLIFGLPRAVRSRTDRLANLLGCCPIVLIPLMVHFTGRTQAWSPKGDGSVAGLDFLEYLEARAGILFVAIGLLVLPWLEFEARTRHIPHGLRTRAPEQNDSKKQEAEGVPEGLELFEIPAPPLLEISVEAALMTLYLIDASLELSGNEALPRLYLRALGTQLAALKGGLALALAAVGSLRLQRAVVGTSWEHWGTALLPGLGALTSFLVLNTGLSHRAALAQAGLLFLAMANATLQITRACRDLKHLAIEVPPVDKKVD